MTGPTVPGREPLQIVEIEQPRCVNRFGTSPCTATGAPKCFQTFTTCADRVNFDGTGSIKWRFGPNVTGLPDTGDYSDADNPQTTVLPGLVSVSSSSSKLNISGILRGESPLGIRATCNVVLEDFPFNDFVGDFYRADRTLGEATFWELWQVRNRFYAGMFLRVYDGYVGQSLDEMDVRLYVVDKVEGPTGGQVRITGIDPLRLTEATKAEFPRTTDILLAADIEDDATTIEAWGSLADFTDDFGNTSEHYIRLGNEFISYTGATEVEAGKYSLDGVTRAALGTTAESGQADDKLQRVGYYSKKLIWHIAHDLIVSHSSIPDALADLDDWDDEAGAYLAAFKVSGVVPEPTPVEDLLAELCFSGQFSIWWDERLQAIPLIVVQPPAGVVPELTDADDILTDPAVKRLPDERVTRVFVYYGVRDWTGSLTAAENFRTAHVRVSTDDENENASDSIVKREIFSRWIQTLSQALSASKRVIDLYANIPERLVVEIDAKDRAYGIGSVLDVATRAFKDTEGNPLAQRWQVVSFEEAQHGHRYRVEAQTFPYEGKFANIMADGSPVYASATDAEKLDGCWLSEDTGLMPDGTEGYLLR